MIAQDKLAEIVGAGNINVEQSTLQEYTRDMSFVNAVKPGCIVKPRTMADIESIVKLANETLTPLVPVSSDLHTSGAIPFPVSAVLLS